MPDQVNGRLSPWLRKKRIDAVRSHISGRVLDLGCGVGALTSICLPHAYVGVDIDRESLDIARKMYPRYRFETERPDEDKFDTIVLLAVIEHMEDPESFLRNIKCALKFNGKILITTPHPCIKRVYSYGSKIGLFSSAAEQQHEQLIDYARMKKIVSNAGLIIQDYKRFLLGANQLFVVG